MNKPDNNFEVGLGFKVHNKRFDSLNEELDHIGNLMKVAKEDIKVTDVYFIFLESLYFRYAGYLVNEEEIEKKLKSVETLLNDSKYKSAIKEAVRMDRGFTNKIITHNNSIIKKLNYIFRDMIKSFMVHELLPKPQKVQIKASEREEDPKKKLELQAEEFLEM